MSYIIQSKNIFRKIIILSRNLYTNKFNTIAILSTLLLRPFSSKTQFKKISFYYVILKIRKELKLIQTLGETDFKPLVYLVNSIILLYISRAYQVI